MLGSPNGPAYGSRPKLVVMKVLCKLRWRKIRHPLIFPHSLHLHSLYSSFSFCLPVHFFLCSLNLSDKVQLSLCLLPSHPLFSSFPLSFLYLFLFPSLRLSLILSSLFMLSRLSISVVLFHAHCSLCLFTKIDLSLICCLSVFSSSLFCCFYQPLLSPFL